MLKDSYINRIKKLKYEIDTEYLELKKIKLSINYKKTLIKELENFIERNE